jgi:hypothetical protein
MASSYLGAQQQARVASGGLASTACTPPTSSSSKHDFFQVCLRPSNVLFTIILVPRHQYTATNSTFYMFAFAACHVMLSTPFALDLFKRTSLVHWLQHENTYNALKELGWTTQLKEQLQTSFLQHWQKGKRRRDVLLIASRSTRHHVEDGVWQEATPSRRGVLGIAAVSGIAATQALLAFHASALTLEDVTPSIAPAPALSAM